MLNKIRHGITKEYFGRGNGTVIGEGGQMWTTGNKWNLSIITSA